jgi:hypothetical protein
MRTIRYPLRTDETMVFTFNRAAEDQSDWVFPSMKDESGANSLGRPENENRRVLL